MTEQYAERIANSSNVMIVTKTDFSEKIEFYYILHGLPRCMVWFKDSYGTMVTDRLVENRDVSNQTPQTSDMLPQMTREEFVNTIARLNQ